MNEQNSKKIIFNKSTLLSLKAELLKKQEEVFEKKQLPQNRLENFKPIIKASDDEKQKDKKSSLRDNLKAINIEELEACRKSKAVLEKKASLYEHLSDSSGTSQLAGRFLVDFNAKKQQEAPKSESSSVPEQIGIEDNDSEDDSEWTEFTDCLGRTRKCLKTNFHLYMEKDKELMKIITSGRTSPDRETEMANNIDEPNKIEKPFLVQKTNDYLHSLREKWEQKEQELLAKDQDIHYQDLLFDEARMHGVAYYSFSTDEEERRKQMEELIKRREETLRAQQESEEKRKKRDELLAARVAAARARQRARAGLPPEEPQDNSKDFTTCLLEFLTQQKDEADAKAKEAEKKIREEQEKERQKFREAYVREWDVGKEAGNSRGKKFRELSQEEYVEQQRDKRIDEFAPFQASTNKRSKYSYDHLGKLESAGAEEPAPSKSWAEVRPPRETLPPPPPDVGDITEQKGLYFSTCKKPQAHNIKYPNFIKAQEPTLIRNELENEFENRDRNHEKGDLESNYSEIAPPPTFDYYGPVPTHSRTQKPFESNIAEAYAQGAKSLESKGSSRQLSKQYDFTFD